MQKLILFLVVLVAFAACKKDNDVAPADPAAAVAGTYVVSRIALDGPGTAADVDEKYPETVNGITYASELIVNQTANTTDRISFVVKVKETGEDDYEFITAEDIEVRRNGSNYDLYFRTVKIGTATGSNVTLDTTEGGIRYIVEARR